MLEQIKRKRLNITHSFEQTKPRVNSTQKRRKIQANLLQFQMDIKKSHTGSAFYQESLFQRGPQSQFVSLNQSPTMKDLIEQHHIQQNQNNTYKFDSPRFQSQQLEHQIQNKITQQNDSIQKSVKVQNNQHQIESNENQVQLKQINNQSLKYSNFISPNSPLIQKNQQINNEQSEQNKDKNTDNQAKALNFNYNQSKYGSSSNGSSAILFTSQFKQFFNRGQQIQQNNLAENVNEENPNNENMKHQNQQVKQKIQIEEIQNSKSKSQVSPKNSNNQIHKTQNQLSHSQNPQTEKQINESFLKIGEDDISQFAESRQKKLQHNQSGRSLAFSHNDDSMLRQSKPSDVSRVLDIFHKKLDVELVLDIDHVRKQEETNNENIQFDDLNKIQQSMSSPKKQQNLKNKIYNLKDCLGFFLKLAEITEVMQYRQKKQFFNQLIVLEQYHFQIVKNQIKSEKFIKQKQFSLVQNIFYAWKSLQKQNSNLILQKQRQNKNKMLKNIFEVFKVIWYDSKIRRQANLYFLSKIFISWRTTIEKQKKRKDSLAIKHYCNKLKCIYFQKIKEGISALQKQKYNEKLAYQHYNFSKLKKFFQAWQNQCNSSPQYISLTMTSKNTFRQTLDNKWLGIKTVDFKQIRK